MKSALVLAALTGFAGGSCAAQSYDNYDAFYAVQPGIVFRNPIKHDAGVVYSYPGEEGVHTELRASLEGKAIRIMLAENRLTINGRVHRFASAQTFPGEHPSAIYPLTADVFLASRTNGHPAVLCIQGSSDGSGESDRYSQIYLLVRPLAPKGKATFLHLPGLLSSCRAILETKNRKLAFPKNSYLFDGAQEFRIGLLLSYYTFEGGHFVPTSDETRLRFKQREVPFLFSVEGK